MHDLAEQERRLPSSSLRTSRQTQRTGRRDAQRGFACCSRPIVSRCFCCVKIDQRKRPNFYNSIPSRYRCFHRYLQTNRVHARPVIESTTTTNDSPIASWYGVCTSSVFAPQPPPRARGLLLSTTAAVRNNGGLASPLNWVAFDIYIYHNSATRNETAEMGHDIVRVTKLELLLSRIRQDRASQ